MREKDDAQILCGVYDFEISADNKIYGLTNATTAPNNGQFVNAGNGYTYTLYNDKRGITLLREVPVFIDANNKTSNDYNSESVCNIAAGIDGSLWALLYEPN